METLSIAILNWRDSCNPGAGGAERYTREVATRWAARGHEVTLVTSAFEGGQAEEVQEGVRIIRGGGPIGVYRFAKRTYVRRLGKECDVLIDEINTRPFRALTYASEGTRVFAFIHQLAREYWTYETPFPASTIGRYLLEDYWLRLYRDVPTVTVSASTRADLTAIGFREVHIVPNGLSVPPSLSPLEKEAAPTLIYLSRFKRVKLPDHALRAFSLVRERLPSCRLWMVGDGYLQARLARRAPPGVEFFGRVSEKDKFDLLRRAHVLICPAVREGWGQTVLEAGACGTPAVGYDVPGLRDSILQGKTGLRTRFGDPRELARAVISLLEDDTARQRMAEAASAFAQTFNWDTTADQFMRVLAG